MLGFKCLLGPLMVPPRSLHLSLQGCTRSVRSVSQLVRYLGFVLDIWDILGYIPKTRVHLTGGERAAAISPPDPASPASYEGLRPSNSGIHPSAEVT